MRTRKSRFGSAVASPAAFNRCSRKATPVPRASAAARPWAAAPEPGSLVLGPRGNRHRHNHRKSVAARWRDLPPHRPAAPVGEWRCHERPCTARRPASSSSPKAAMPHGRSCGISTPSGRPASASRLNRHLPSPTWPNQAPRSCSSRCPRWPPTSARPARCTPIRAPQRPSPWSFVSPVNSRPPPRWSVNACSTTSCRARTADPDRLSTRVRVAARLA